MAKLKPCPFCGSEVVMTKNYQMTFVDEQTDDVVEWNMCHGLAVVCLSCLANMPSFEEKERENLLAEAWNDRKKGDDP